MKEKNKAIEALKKIFSAEKKYDPQKHTLVAIPTGEMSQADTSEPSKIKLRIIDIADQYDDDQLEQLSMQCEAQVHRIAILKAHIGELQEKVANHKVQLSGQLQYFMYMESEAIRRSHHLAQEVARLRAIESDQQLLISHQHTVEEKYRKQLEVYRKEITLLNAAQQEKKLALKQKLLQNANPKLEKKVKEYQILYNNTSNQNTQLKATINSLKAANQTLKNDLQERHLQEHIILQQRIIIQEQADKIAALEQVLLLEDNPTSPVAEAPASYSFGQDIGRHMYLKEERSKEELKQLECQKKLAKKEQQIQLLKNELKILISKMLSTDKTE